MTSFDLTSFMAGGMDTVPLIKHKGRTYIGFREIDNAIECNNELKNTNSVKTYLKYKNKVRK